MCSSDLAKHQIGSGYWGDNINKYGLWTLLGFNGQYFGLNQGLAACNSITCYGIAGDIHSEQDNLNNRGLPHIYTSTVNKFSIHNPYLFHAKCIASENNLNFS